MTILYALLVILVTMLATMTIWQWQWQLQYFIRVFFGGGLTDICHLLQLHLYMTWPYSYSLYMMGAWVERKAFLVNHLVMFQTQYLSHNREVINHCATPSNIQKGLWFTAPITAPYWHVSSQQTFLYLILVNIQWSLYWNLFQGRLQLFNHRFITT